MTDPLTPEAIAALTDAELTERVAVDVMGWQLDGPFQRFWVEKGDPTGTRGGVKGELGQWNPLTDYNDTHAVIEAKRRQWAEEGSQKIWDFSDTRPTDYQLERSWWVYVVDETKRFHTGISVNRTSFARAVCEAALRDSLKG